MAKTVLKKRKVEIAENRFLDRRLKDKTLFKAFVKQFLDIHSSTKRSAGRDEEILEKFKERWGAKQLSDISRHMIEEWRAERAKDVKQGTVNRELECLKTFFNKAVEWGKLENSPARQVRKFKLNNQRKRYITQKQFNRLLGECSPNLKPIVVVARHTGLRRGEILALCWSDVDFRAGTLHVRNSKNGEAREIPMNASVQAALKALPRKIGETNVFAVQHVKSSFERACENAKITDFTFHDLRHTFASHLVMCGVDLNTVRELLGHKTMAMTLRYSHLSPTHRGKAVEVLDSYVDTPVDTEAADADQ